MATNLGPLRSYVSGILFGSFIFGMIYCISSFASRFVEDSSNQGGTEHFKRDMINHGKNFESKVKVSKSADKNASLVDFKMMECPVDETILDQRILDELDCKKRLPQVIGIGFEKCGTGALSFFLNSHPSLRHSIPQEIYYWNKNPDKDLDWYREQMPVSSKYQVTMEKTPSYVFDKPDIPQRILTAMPRTKFIVMIRDPIVRSVSDYLHLKAVGLPEFFTPRFVPPGAEPLCYLNTTFEGSVIKPNGDVNSDNAILTHSAYVLYLKRWIKLFPRRQFLVIDGDDFVKKPLPILQEVETFLDIPKYFNEKIIFFDEEKGFFCKSKLRGKGSVCAGETKGRRHPDVDENVIRKLRSYFRSYNTQLETLLGKRFSWS